MPAGSLDRWPEDYERGRPGWPREAVDLPGLPPAATVLDLGAGTGKLTRLLVSAFGRVIAVEPADAMRRLLVTLCPAAEALPGTGQEIPLPVTVPEPLPESATVRLCVAGGLAAKLAVTDLSELSVRVQALVPLHPPPDQPLKLEPDWGVAVNVKMEPCA